MSIKTYYYVNKLGYEKILTIETDPDNTGKYYFNIWDNVHGEFCGAGHMTKTEVNDFLKAYNVNENFAPK